LAVARQAWLAARTPYSQSEVFRFYSGPIDGDNGPETLLNSWPIDEAYVDYVKDEPNSGIINDLAHFPSINMDLLVSLNQKEGETNVSTGYHALEFLLWGQNFHDEGPGNRPYTDYVVEAAGKSNAQRRRQYLLASADLLVRDLDNVTKEWAADRPDNYRAKFLALPPDAAIKNMLTGMAVLAGVELSGERMLVALDTKIAKEEQSCFSDNTHNDIIENARGIANLFYGNYRRIDSKTISGPGVYDLAQKIWGAEPGILKIDMDQVMEDVKKIPPPFGRAILGEDSAPGRQQVNATVNSLTTLAGDLAQFGQRQGMHINITSAKDGDE
jgi:putative iron-regulated protein